jgi:hypothetical protein
MSEAALIAHGLIQGLHTFQARLIHLLNNELGNPVTPPNSIGLVAQIDEADLYFTSVISIYGAGAVDNADPVSACQPAPWTHLTFKSYRKGHGDSGGDDCHSTYLHDLLAFDSGAKIHP